MRDAPDPDGVRRCFGHSQRPDIIARREACAEKGRTAGAKQEGVRHEHKKVATSGAIPAEEVRKVKARLDVKDAPPFALVTKADVRSFLEKAAGELLAGGDPQTANAAANVVRSALAIIAAEEPPPPEQEVVGFRVRRVDRNTKPEQLAAVN